MSKRIVQRNAQGESINRAGSSLPFASHHCLFSRVLTVTARAINGNLTEISEPSPH